MRAGRIALLVVLVAAAGAGSALRPAIASPPTLQAGSCESAAVPLDRRLLDRIRLHREETIGFSGGSQLPPFLIVPLSDADSGTDAEIERDTEISTVLVVKTDGSWSAINLGSGMGLQGAIFSREGATVAIASMFGREGPGSTYELLVTRDGFKTIACSAVPFPDVFNKIEYGAEYLQFRDFNFASDGTGGLVGEAQWNSDPAPPPAWFVYESGDWGGHWSEPHRADREPPPVAGVMSRVGADAIDSVIDDLLSTAR